MSNVELRWYIVQGERFLQFRTVTETTDANGEKSTSRTKWKSVPEVFG